MIKEKRSHYRLQVDLPIIYTYSGEHGNITNEGTTFDLSDSGMCFYTDMPFHKGLNLQVNLTHIWDSQRASVVKWCSMENIDLYRVGVSFQ